MTMNIELLRQIGMKADYLAESIRAALKTANCGQDVKQSPATIEASVLRFIADKNELVTIDTLKTTFSTTPSKKLNSAVMSLVKDGRLETVFSDVNPLQVLGYKAVLPLPERNYPTEYGYFSTKYAVDILKNMHFMYDQCGPDTVATYPDLCRGITYADYQEVKESILELVDKGLLIAVTDDNNDELIGYKLAVVKQQTANTKPDLTIRHYKPTPLWTQAMGRADRRVKPVGIGVMVLDELHTCEGLWLTLPDIAGAIKNKHGKNYGMDNLRNVLDALVAQGWVEAHYDAQGKYPNAWQYKAVAGAYDSVPPDDHLYAANVTVFEMKVLNIIEDRDYTSIDYIASSLNSIPPRVAKAIRNLVELGLIECHVRHDLAYYKRTNKPKPNFLFTVTDGGLVLNENGTNNMVNDKDAFHAIYELLLEGKWSANALEGKTGLNHSVVKDVLTELSNTTTVTYDERDGTPIYAINAPAAPDKWNVATIGDKILDILSVGANTAAGIANNLDVPFAHVVTALKELRASHKVHKTSHKIGTMYAWEIIRPQAHAVPVADEPKTTEFTTMHIDYIKLMRRVAEAGPFGLTNDLYGRNDESGLTYLYSHGYITKPTADSTAYTISTSGKAYLHNYDTKINDIIGEIIVFLQSAEYGYSSGYDFNGIYNGIGATDKVTEVLEALAEACKRGVIVANANSGTYMLLAVESETKLSALDEAILNALKESNDSGWSLNTITEKTGGNPSDYSRVYAALTGLTKIGLLEHLYPSNKWRLPKNKADEIEPITVNVGTIAYGAYPENDAEVMFNVLETMTTRSPLLGWSAADLCTECRKLGFKYSIETVKQMLDRLIKARYVNVKSSELGVSLKYHVATADNILYLMGERNNPSLDELLEYMPDADKDWVCTALLELVLAGKIKAKFSL